MKLSQFKFRLPEEQVALYPPHREFPAEDGSVERVFDRDACRLMVLHRKSGRIEMHKKDDKGKDTDEFLTFRNIVDYFDEGDVFIFNDTKVFPARLYGNKEKTDAEIEVFLLRELDPVSRLWDVLVEPARKIRIGNKLFFDGDGPMVAEVLDNTTSRGRILRFLYDCDHEEFKQELFRLGIAPLPRYITNHRKADKDDLENFQTIFAANEGAVTAPSTGLHFSRQLMKIMEIYGLKKAFITEHCSLSAFESIEVEDLSKHKMSSEFIDVKQPACDIVNKAKLAGHRICAVGVSTVRATESCVGTDGLLKPSRSDAPWTNKFIFPPYDFGLSNAMVANFYHPESVMLMCTAAFGGYQKVMDAYETAVKNGYMFGCYGDALLIVDD